MGILKHRYIDPGTSLSEVLFGLIMTLTFTLGAGIMIQEEGREGARQLLIATIGCNIAWGIIDGALFPRRPAVRSRANPCPGSGRAPGSTCRLPRSVVAGELDEMLGPVTTDAERAAFTDA